MFSDDKNWWTIWANKFLRDADGPEEARESQLMAASKLIITTLCFNRSFHFPSTFTGAWDKFRLIIYEAFNYEEKLWWNNLQERISKREARDNNGEKVLKIFSFLLAFLSSLQADWITFQLSQRENVVFHKYISHFLYRFIFLKSQLSWQTDEIRIDFTFSAEPNNESVEKENQIFYFWLKSGEIFVRIMKKSHFHVNFQFSGNCKIFFWQSSYFSTRGCYAGFFLLRVSMCMEIYFELFGEFESCVTHRLGRAEIGRNRSDSAGIGSFRISAWARVREKS